MPGLFALIFFTTFNNFLGGVFMALMDAYGLSLVSVQAWGTLWGFLSLSFILGGLYIAKKGLGADPLRILFRNNIITWTVCIFFTIQPSITLLAVGTFIWMFFVPFIEAIEQTIFQKVVPPERLGRVFGFAHSIEQAASPVTAFLIGPIAHFTFIPVHDHGGRRSPHRRLVRDGSRPGHRARVHDRGNRRPRRHPRRHAVERVPAARRALSRSAAGGRDA